MAFVMPLSLLVTLILHDIHCKLFAPVPAGHDHVTDPWQEVYERRPALLGNALCVTRHDMSSMRLPVACLQKVYKTHRRQAVSHKGLICWEA